MLNFKDKLIPILFDFFSLFVPSSGRRLSKQDRSFKPDQYNIKKPEEYKL